MSSKFSLENYFVSDSASTTLEIRDFHITSAPTTAYFSPSNNNGTVFYILLSPKDLKVDTDYVYMHIEIKKLDQNSVLAQHDVSLIDVNGTKQFTRSFIREYMYMSDEFRAAVFYRGDIVNSPISLLHNGTMQVLVETFILAEKKPDQPPNLPILSDFKTLLETGKCSDFTFIVHDKEFKVHKAILSARSPVLAAMFEHDCEENRQSRAEITDIDVEVFEDLLRYLYTDSVESFEQNAADLLVAADKYQLESLKSTCSKYLCSAVSVETFAKLLLLSHLHGIGNLKTLCLKYFEAHCKEIVTTKDWDLIVATSPELLSVLIKILAMKS